MTPTPPKEDNYLDVSCPTCGAVPKHGHFCTPPKDVEQLQAIIEEEVENCGGDTTLLARNLTNLVTTHTDRRVRKEREAWLQGLRCDTCGLPTDPNGVSRTCLKCWQEL